MFVEDWRALVNDTVAIQNFDQVLSFDHDRAVHDCLFQVLEEKLCSVAGHAESVHYLGQLLVV